MEYKLYGGNNDLYRAAAKDDEPILKVIMEGDYRERHFVIGAHCTGNPNAYLEVKEADAVNQESQKDDWFDGGLSRVHGGSTYFGRAYWDKDDSKTYVGWDYGHLGDYCARHPEFGGTKWTLINILMEIACAENEIQELNDEDQVAFLFRI